MTVTYKDWNKMLPFALHGYRTSARTSTGTTPYSLVYGMEAVLPIEVQIPSIRIMKDTGLSEDDCTPMDDSLVNMEGSLLLRFLLFHWMVALSLWNIVCYQFFCYSNGW